MGVTIKCKKTGREMDVGYFGFFKLRTKVAELVGSEDRKSTRLNSSHHGIGVGGVWV